MGRLSQQRVKRNGGGCLRLLVILGALALGLGAGLLIGWLKGPLPPVPKEPGITRITDRNGLVLAELYREYREPVSLSAISPALVDAVLAVEDRAFYQHHGLDLKGIVRALFANLRHREWAQGGSTITQQLARHLWLSREKSLMRKVKEALLALKLEQHFSKTELLERYLNTVYFGSGAYGVEAAARTYFRKGAGEVSLQQAALLAGLIRNPSGYSPFQHPEKSKARTGQVLQAMVEAGFLKANLAKSARSESPGLASGAPPRKGWKATYFVQQVVRELELALGDEVVYKQALVVRTSLDLEVQQAAEKAVIRTCGRYSSRGVRQAACVLLDIYTGEVLAWVGGKSFEDSQYDRVVQAQRQPGSAFKPFVYATAVEQHYPPEHLLEDRPVTIMQDGTVYKPRNYDRRYRGTVTMAKALVDSINVPTVELARQVGLDNVLELAKRLGITSDLRPYLSSVLGASEVKLLDITAAYASFANLGYVIKPRLVLEVRDERELDLTPVPAPPVQALDEQTAWTVGEMLRLAVEYGTGTPARFGKWELGGKTGTSSDNRDLYFVGFCSGAVCGVWAGNDENKPTYGTYGGMVSAPVFRETMAAWCERYSPPVELPRPVSLAKETRLTSDVLRVSREERAEEYSESGISDWREKAAPEQDQSESLVRDICVDSGLLAGPGCPNVEERTFKPGEEPTRQCPGNHSEP